MMHTYIVLLRGINVGGKNKVSMATLKTCLEKLGFSDVSTYIASGNVILKSNKHPSEIKDSIENNLIKSFKLDSELIKVLVLSHKDLQAVVDHKPKGFGEEPEKYYSDAIFLIDIDVREAMTVFNPREGVDMIWPGRGVIYSQRLGSQRVKSRLGKIIGTKPYKSMTIRSWNTTTKLLEIIKRDEGEFPFIGAPALSALEVAGITKLSQLSNYTEKELLALHGFGPKALRILNEALRKKGLSFKKQ